MAVKGLTIPIGADASDFNKEIKKMERNTKGIQKEVGLLSKSLSVEWDESRFVLAQQKAREAIQQTEVKAQALRDRLAALDEVGEDKQSAHYQKVRNELIKTETNAVLLKDKLEEINQLKMDRIVKSFEDTGAKIEGAGKKLTAFSATAAGILASFSAIGLSAISAADDIATQAAQINLNAEAMQKWNYIAMQTDVSQQDLQNGMMKTQAALSDLATNASSTGATALQRLGLSMEQAALGMDSNIDLIITKLSEIEDPVMQASIANELFGDRMGARFIPLLQSGAEGLQTLTEEFEAVGYMTNEQIENLAEFDNVMNRLKQIFTNLKNELGASLLPMMQMFAAFIEEKLVPIIRKFSDWFINLSEGQKNAIAGILAFVAALGPFLIIIGKMTSGVGGLIKTLGALKGALTTLSTHPIIAIIGVIAALIMYLYSVNEKFRESINGLISVLGEALAPILNTIMNLFNVLIDSLMPVINLISDTLTPIIDMLGDILSSLAPILTLTILPIQLMTKNLEVMMKFLSPLINLITKLANVISGVLANAMDFITKKVGNVVNTVVGWIEKVVNWIIDKINWLIDKLNSLGEYVGITLDKIDNVSFKNGFEVDVKHAVKPTEPVISQTEQVIKSSDTSSIPQSITNNDYSKKDIKVEVIVQNYAEEVDVDEMVRQINLKLAEQM